MLHQQRTSTNPQSTQFKFFLLLTDTNRRHRKKTIKRLMYGPDKPDTLNAISPTHDLTALQLAIKRQWWSIAELLIEAGGLCGAHAFAVLHPCNRSKTDP